MPESEGHAVFFIHTEDDCPLLQDGPEAANTLADNLEAAKPIGGFYPKRHQGAAIGSGAPSEALRQTYQQGLPNHEVALEAIDLEPFETFLNDADYRNSEEGLVEFFEAMADVFPDAELAPEDDERGLMKSLDELPHYLRDNAPTA